MKNISFLSLFVLLFSCQPNAGVQSELSDLKVELERAKANIRALEIEKKGLIAGSLKSNDFPLVHIVYLNLKENLAETSEKSLVTAIENLGEIPQVKNLEYGQFKDLEDARALSDYEMVLKMNFADAADYEIYQAHPVHLELKKVAKRCLAGAPVTYDYLIEG